MCSSDLKATDTGSTIQGGVDFGAADRTSFRREKEPGLAGFDVRHSFYTNFIYDLPGENLSGVSKAVLGGWGVAGLLRLNSGYPLNVSAATPTLGGRAYQFVNGSTVDLIPNGDSNAIDARNPDQYFDVTQFAYPQFCATAAAACGGNVGGFLGNLGRSTMISPGVANVDFTLTKDTGLPMFGEAGSLQFRFELFNLLNRANFSTPSLGLFNFANNTATRVSTAGQITNTATSSRQIQFALKLIF